MKRIWSGGRYKSTLAAVALTAVILLAQPVTLFAQTVYPANSTPFGMTLGDWQAAYLQYFFSIPASINPVNDTTGADCHVAQSSSPVFFLNSTWWGTFVTRTCTIPAKPLFVSVSWSEFSSVEAPPSCAANPQAMRTCAAAFENGVAVNKLKLTVDGEDLSAALQAGRVQSPYYDFTMPATDNILGLYSVTSGSSVSDGYSVMLEPLSPGNHVIYFEGAGAAGSFSVTYNVTVK